MENTENPTHTDKGFDDFHLIFPKGEYTDRQIGIMLRLFKKCEDRLLEEPVIAFCYLRGSMHDDAPVIFQWSGPYKTGNDVKFNFWSAKRCATVIIKQNRPNSNEVSILYDTTTSSYDSFYSIEIRFRRKPARVKRTRDTTGDPTL